MSLLRRIAAAVFSAAGFSTASFSAMAGIVVLMPRLPRSKSVVVARATRAKCRGPPAPRRDLPVQPSTVPWPRPPPRAVLPVRATAHLEICCPLTGRFPVRQQGEELSAYREIHVSLDMRFSHTTPIRAALAPTVSEGRYAPAKAPTTPRAGFVTRRLPAIRVVGKGGKERLVGVRPR